MKLDFSPETVNDIVTVIQQVKCLAPKKGIIIEQFCFSDFNGKDKKVVGVTVEHFGEKTETFEEDVKTILNDMGKWESATQFLHDSKLKLTSSNLHFGYELYAPKITPPPRETKNQVGSVAFVLTEKEALRRSKGVDAQFELGSAEIRSQIKNIPKWRNLAKLTQNLRATFG